MGDNPTNSAEFLPEEKEGMSKIVCDQLVKLTSSASTSRFLKRLILLQELSEAWLNGDDVRLLTIKKPRLRKATMATLPDSVLENTLFLYENGSETDNCNQKPTQFCCEHCGKLFQRTSLLNRHLKSHYGTGKSTFKCRDCGRVFTRAGGLKRHMATHSGEKPCICSKCGKQFSRLDHLVLHMRIHTGERPYKCNECGKQFTTGPHLKKHFRMHDKEAAYVCSCHGKGFCTAEDIKTHFQEL